MAIFEAINVGDRKSVEALLHLGINANQRDRKTSDTPLIRACQSGDDRRSTELAKLLLRYGANIHLTDYLGRTALHWACATTKKAFFNLLISCYSSKEGLNFSDFSGNTALFHAVGTKKCSFVRHVVKTLAPLCYDVLTRKNGQGYTAGEVALHQGHSSCFKYIEQMKRHHAPRHKVYSDITYGKDSFNLDRNKEENKTRLKEDSYKITSDFEIDQMDYGKKNAKLDEHISENARPNLKRNSFLPRIEKVSVSDTTGALQFEARQRRADATVNLPVSYVDILPQLGAMWALQQSPAYRPGFSVAVSLQKENIIVKNDEKKGETTKVEAKIKTAVDKNGKAKGRRRKKLKETSKSKKMKAVT